VQLPNGMDRIDSELSSLECFGANVADSSNATKELVLYIQPFLQA
jgi:hypothetical protein